jgi:4-aminobutyrate aminotransferase/(S)-3-amino-2-methylpropionate transaminase
MATPKFFKDLIALAKKEGIPFIVDETKTGLGSTGKYWGHEHWHCSGEKTPDYVSFGGKSGLGGFYAAESHKLNDEGTSFQGNLDNDQLLRVVKYG